MIPKILIIKAKVPTSHKIPERILQAKKENISLKKSFLVLVLLSKTNNLLVIYANKTAQNHDRPLLVTGSMPISLAKIN